jgi:hypothetical protein
LLKLQRFKTLRLDGHHQVADAFLGGQAHWRRVATLVAVNSIQVFLTWWSLREAATASRSNPALGGGVLRVALLVVANALQSGLTWWLYRAENLLGRYFDDWQCDSHQTDRVVGVTPDWCSAPNRRVGTAVVQAPTDAAEPAAMRQDHCPGARFSWRCRRARC